MVDPNLPFTVVRASRGKVTRAEPTAALYKQGRMHRIGAFPQLEEQMTNFTSDFNRETAGYSPDRVDALVWAATELLVEQMKRYGIFELYRRLASGKTIAQIAGTSQPENPPDGAKQKLIDKLDRVAERKDANRPEDAKAEQPKPTAAGGTLLDVYLRAKKQALSRGILSQWAALVTTQPTSSCYNSSILNYLGITLALGPGSCYDTYATLWLHPNRHRTRIPRAGGHVGLAVIQRGAELPGPG
jgi:hypothetical protein